MNRAVRYGEYFLLFCVIYAVSLCFVFPGYFKPFIPIHSDILDYPYDLVEGGYTVIASRPIGLILNTLWGSLYQYKGITIGGFATTLFSMLLIIDITEYIQNKKVGILGVIVYGILTLMSPTFYLSYVFDIFGTYALFFWLIAVRILCSGYSGEKHDLLYLVALLLSFLSKETYIVCACFFSFIYAIVNYQTDRAKSIKLFAITVFAAIISLLYGKILGSAFTSTGSSDINSPYYVSISFSSIIDCFTYYISGIYNIPIIIAFGLLIVLAIIKRNSQIWILIAFSTSGVLALLPYSVLPNKLVPHYIFSAIPILMSFVFLYGNEFRRPYIKSIIGKNIVSIVMAVVFSFLSILFYAKKGVYTYEVLRPWISSDKKMELTLRDTDDIKAKLNDSDKVLVLGLEDTVETLYRSLFEISRRFGKKADFDVLIDTDVFTGKNGKYTTYISKINPAVHYHKIVVYNDSGYTIFNGDKLLDIVKPILTEQLIYPGIELHSEDCNNDGSINMAVRIGYPNDLLAVCINGKEYQTCYGDDFISINVPKEILDDRRFCLSLYHKRYGVYSNEIAINVNN